MLLGIEGSGPTLRRGSSGPAVAVVQQALRVTADGKFGPATEAAVKAFQKSKGLTPDGIVGPLTWGALPVSAPAGSASSPAPSSGGGPPAAAVGGEGEGLPWGKILLGVGVAGVAIYLATRKKGRAVKRNPHGAACGR